MMKNPVVRYLLESCGQPESERRPEMARQFPNISDAEIAVAAEIAQKILRAEAAEGFREASALEDYWRQRQAIERERQTATKLRAVETDGAS